MDLKTFGQAIRELADEKGVAVDKVILTVETAIAAAYKKEYGKRGQIIHAKFNPESGTLDFWQVKIAVDESMIKSEEEIQAEEETRRHGLETRPAKTSGEGTGRITEEEIPQAEEIPRKVRFNPERHIMIDEAKALKPEVKAEDELEFPLEAKYEFGRIASQTAKQVIIQRIREAEREATYAEYKGREGEVVSGLVQRIEGRNVFVDLGRGTGLILPDEQIPHEHFRIGERLKAVVLLVEKETRGPGILLSRSHPKFLKKLFEIEVPEIDAGTVEIKAMAREPGSRSKVAVMSHDQAVDPVGSLVGQRGVRVSAVINEIGGEKIDIVEFSEDPAAFIANALSPAKVLGVELNEARKETQVMVPDDQLSLAIGKGGQNVRLAAKLTGWRIDVRSRQTPTPAAKPEETPETENQDTAGEETDIAAVNQETKKETSEGASTAKTPSEKQQDEIKPKRKPKTKDQKISREPKIK